MDVHGQQNRDGLCLKGCKSFTWIPTCMHLKTIANIECTGGTFIQLKKLVIFCIKCNSIIYTAILYASIDYSIYILDHLTSLIKEASNHDVKFVYALSPGLDMTYSNAKELSCLKRKLEQVADEFFHTTF